MSDVREICARLDGMPLAIELAAARMRALAPSDVLARLGDRFRLLTTGSRTAPPRHQTLRAVIDWSYDLLFDEERRVFERMAVFAGECTLPAAEQVCAGDTIGRDDVADLLARLVDRSLVMATQTGPGVRFRVLQTLAEYGRERLAARGDLAAVRARHARWVASFVNVADGGQGPAWFAAVSKSLEDIRRAMESALASGDADTSLALACGLAWFWGGGGVIDDCWRWLTASLSLAQEPTARSVRALALAEHLSLAQGRDHALAYGEKAVGLGRTVGDPSALAFAAVIHGSALAGFFGQREHAVQLLEEAGALLQSDGGDWSAATGLLSCGVAALVRTDLDQAWTLLRRAADDFATMGNARAKAAALRQLADLCCHARPLRRRSRGPARGAVRPGPGRSSRGSRAWRSSVACMRCWDNQPKPIAGTPAPGPQPRTSSMCRCSRSLATPRASRCGGAGASARLNTATVARSACAASAAC